MAPTAKPAGIDLTPVETPQPVRAPQAVTADQSAHLSDLDKVQMHLASQPREMVRIRKEDGRQFVQIQGYGISIQPGEWVEIPRQAADMLREAGVL